MNISNNLSVTSPKKKVPKRTFIIEDVIVKDNDKVEPCLVQFSNGVVKDTSNLEGKLLQNMSKKNINQRSERILTVSSDKMTYTGKNFGENVDSKITNRNFLGILDKKTNKMKLIEVSTFMMHPQFDKSQTSTDTFIANLTQNEKRRQLNQTFGGRRERATIRKIEARQFDVHDMAGALHDTTQNIDTEELEEGFDEVFSYADILPPCDRNEANLVENVYKLSDIIPDTELILYNDEAVEYMDNNRNLDALSPLVRQTIVNAKLSKDEEETAKLICTALYIQNLIQLLQTRYKEKPALKACPKLLEKKILTNFSEGIKKRSKAMEDKLIAHIIVLSLIANRFKVQWTSLCQSLAIKKDRLTIIVNIIGAKVLKSKGFVSLELPLAKNVNETPVRSKKNKRMKLF